MTRLLLVSLLPWLGVLVAALAVAWLVVRLSNARFDWSRLVRLHEDQQGSAQTLSFVLTLPIFVWVVMLIVQVSQLMIAQVVVEYAAFAAARSAIVWIPARVDSGSEPTNCISAYFPDPEAPDQVFPITDPTDPAYGPMEGGLTFVVAPGGPKYQKIFSAAVMALLSICPSRDVGARLPAEGEAAADILRGAYLALAPGGTAGPEDIDRRVRNKLAYALANTSVEVRFYHTNRYPEPPLVTYCLPDDVAQFRFNELGWQDTITVTVRHQLALLPGPGRLLWRWRNVNPPDGTPDRGAQQIQQQGRVYTYPLVASATLGNEGLESVIPYEYLVY